MKRSSKLLRVGITILLAALSIISLLPLLQVSPLAYAAAPVVLFANPHVNGACFLLDNQAYHDNEQVLVTPREQHTLRARADCLRGEGWGLAYWQTSGSVVVDSLYEESTIFTVGESGGKIIAYLGAVPKAPFTENPFIPVRTITQTSILWLTSVSIYYVGETHLVTAYSTQVLTLTEFLTSTQVVNTTETSVIYSTQVVNSTQTVNATQTVTVTETTTATNSTGP